MFIKIYDLIKKFIKRNLLVIIFLIILQLITLIKLPYVINYKGGVEKLTNRIEMKDGYKSKGDFYASYVQEITCNPLTYLFAKVFNLEMVPIDEVIYPNETMEDDYTRNSILFDVSLSNAILLAYQKSNQEINILSEEKYVLYKSLESNTDLQIGDIIVSINGKSISNNLLENIFKNNKEKDRIDIEVINNGKTYNRYAYLYEKDNNLLMGVSLVTKYNYKTKKEYKIKSYKGLGPSGGLMNTLYIYNLLTEYDYTHGLKIAGTGTIDIDGNVGEIAGVNYKIIGADKAKADIFLCPSANYDLALKTKNEKNLNIKLVKVDTFDEVIEYLSKLE